MLTKADIEKYFLAEKQVGLIFIIIGALAIAFAFVFFFVLRNNFYKGAAIPLLLIGLIELTIGFVVYKRSDGDRVRNVYAYDMNPQELKEQELPRMQKVNKGFTIYKWVEMVLIITGIILIGIYRSRPEKAFWFGLGVALTIQALLMLGADYFAEKRAKDYTSKLQAFTQ
ncbi:hypothetical protein HB364_06730 [Pseudoflavitalea sp. X16]|uniref:hypothetical protein n=1 Tax=Paraflavitalea devenefica TaxID=2716334 RepID=UPI0014226915|nr:hypothetical protein [Paraflavitalea devenefica]NII24764.1 hypothetical protein [Paraflavitalea devenefica]